MPRTAASLGGLFPKQFAAVAVAIRHKYRPDEALPASRFSSRFVLAHPPWGRRFAFCALSPPRLAGDLELYGEAGAFTLHLVAFDSSFDEGVPRDTAQHRPCFTS